MDKLSVLKGIHPGFFLERELAKRRLGKSKFAMSIGEYPQTLSAIMNGKRNMNTALSLRIEKELGMEEGFLMTLQVFYEIKQEKDQRSKDIRPDISKFRPALFWDTKLEDLNWLTQKRAIITRVLERGNTMEKKELERFYGRDEISKLRSS